MNGLPSAQQMQRSAAYAALPYKKDITDSPVLRLMADNLICQTLMLEVGI